MKPFKVLIITVLVVVHFSLKAQISASINLASPPRWGPIGYGEARYYYLPDIQSYYDVQSALFIYYKDGRWQQKASLPSRYRNYDLYDGYKVVMTDYHGESPYENFREHKMRYKIGYRRGSQKTIGERPEESKSRFKGDNKGEDKTKGHDEDSVKQGNH
jgi:hypothetical protein